MRGDDMPSNLEKLRERVYGSANPTKEQVQVVRNRASTLSSAAPSWAQPKGRVASPSLPTASGALRKAGRPTTAGKPGKITSPAREAERQAEELRTLRDEAQQEFLNFRGAEITAGAAGMPTEPYTGQRYRTAEEAYRARQDYDRQLAELRNRYYQEENEQQRARLAEDASMQATFARADEIRGALNRIQTLEQTRAAAPGPVTEDAVNQAVREIAGQYGLSREDSRNLTTVRKALEAQLLEETDRISAAGYDYERMTEYQKRQERAAEAERQRQQTEAWADEHPVLASLASVGASALQAVDIPRLIATGGGSEDDLRTYTPADPNAAIISNFVTGVRDTVSKKIADNTDWELFGQNVASFLYNTGMSIGDSASQVALLGPWATYLMGASAASQQAVNVLERGGSNSQAFWGGLAAGAAEAVFERFSIEKLLEAKTINSVKDLLRATAQQAGTEASEEMLTEIANILSDTAIMGESSDFEQLVTQYQLMGMDEDEARKQAYLDSVAQVVWAGVGGALSGMAMGGATSGVDLAGRNIRQGIRDYQTSPIDDAYAAMKKDGIFSPYARAAAREADHRRGVTEAVDRAAWMTDRWNRKARRDYLKNRGSARGEQELPTASQQAQSPQATQAAPAGTQNAAPEGAAQVQQDQAQPAGRQTQATAADPVIQTLESGERVDQATLSNEQFAVLAERGDMDVDAGGRVYQVDPAQHIDQRSSEDMGDRRINAFQFDHPEVHRYYSEAAAELLNELSVTEKGGQTLRLGDYQTGYEYRRTKRAAPERITVLLDDYGLSYDQIEKALDAIIHNHGQENIAAAKRVEFVLDDMLTNGYQSMDGYIPPNQDYINAKASIAGYVEPAEGGSGYLDGIDEAPVTAERARPIDRTVDGGVQSEQETEERTVISYGRQGAEPGDGVSDGDLGRLSGTGAGEQTGGVETGAERGRGPADTYRAARERQNSVHDLRGEPVSSQDLGLRRGTDAKTLQVIPESAWDDGLRATADRVREETGLDTVFVTGGIQIGTPDGARLVRGVFTGDRIIVQADNIRVTPDQIADHEIFHDRAAQTPGLIRELEDRVREQYGPEELGRVVEQYIRKLRGVIDVTENAGEDGTQAEAWAILEEIFADAYAGINAFSAHAERFGETVEQTMTERGVGRGSQNAAATDRTTGPPEGRQSIDENYAQDIDNWARQGRPDGEVFILGSTGDVLQGLGAMEQDIYLRSEKVNTILQQHPEMTLAEIKRIPEILDDPVLVLKSLGAGARTENTRLVLFGTVRAENGQPVLAVLDLRPVENGLAINDMQKVNSAYTKDNGAANFVRRSEVMYADKKRTAPLLRSIGLTIASRPLLRSGSMGSITYGSNTVNMQGVPFDQVVETTEQSGGQRYSFGGENAQRADLEALDRAQDMERRGVAMENIFRETGWYTGADGKWRFEIDDSGMEYSRWGDLNRSDRAEYARFRELEGKFIDGTITQEEQTELRQLLDQGHGPGRAEEQQTLRLADFLRHDELYQNYPQLRQAALRFADLPEGTHGSYNTGTNTITLNNSLRDAPEDTLVHEIQHAIQSAEGFSGGSSPEYWARREYETGDLVSNRLQQEYDQILNGLGREDQNEYIRYTELERELEHLFLSDPNTEAGRRYDRLEAEQDAIYEELYPNAWFRQLLDLNRRMEDTAGEYRRMYENTAGEIEARDVTARRQLTPEQRRRTMPNTGDENTVFAESGDSYSMQEPDAAAQDEAERLLFQGVDADTIREMTGLERTEDGDWRFAVDTTPAAAYDGGRTTDQQGGLDDGQNEYDLRGVHGENVRRREAGETIPGRPRSAQRRNAAGSQTDEGGRRAAPASWARGRVIEGELDNGSEVERDAGGVLRAQNRRSEAMDARVRGEGRQTNGGIQEEPGQRAGIPGWARGRVIDRPSQAAGIAADNAGRYGAGAFVVEDAVIKERNPNAWALTSGGNIYISNSIPAELADVVGYHEAVHAAKQQGADEYLEFLDRTDDFIDFGTERSQFVIELLSKERFSGKDYMSLSDAERKTVLDELNAVVWGFHKADQENAREQFADMFQDYDAYIADLDAAMESGAEPEVPGLSLPTLDDEDIRYSMDEDTAAEPSDNPPLSPDQSGRSDLHRPRGMSDEQYNRLNERWKNRPVDWRETLAPEGFDSIDDYTAALEAAAEERMRNRSREEFEGSDALKDLGIRIANSVGLYGNTQQLIENDRAAKSIRKEIKRAERRLQATDAEKNFASGVAAGIYGEADIPPSMDADTVMELADYYWAEKAVQNDLIREQRTKINRNLDERVRRLMDGVDDAKTKVPAAVIMRNRTPERNMRRIFGNAKGDEINDYLFRPVQDNEAERIRFVNRMHNEVRTFKDRNGKDRRLNKEERALVQLVIEGRAAEDAVNAMERSRDIQNAAENIKNARKLAGKDDLAKRRQAEIDASVDEVREFNLGTDERRLAIQYSRWLETQERLQGADTTIIGNAVEKYRELFNQLYDAANDFLVAHGYEPIGFIRGYAPHLQSQETQERFNNALERMGINREIGKLPTSIAGRTKNFKPNMPWNGFFKNRNSQGEFLDPDIAEGFEKYVDSMSDVLYHTDDIMRTRAFVRYFRRTYAPEEIRNQLEQADALRYAQADQQASFLRDKGKLSYTSAPTYEDVRQAMEQYVEDQYQAIENLTLYGDLAVFLDDYANNLANKQLFEDRAMEKSFGRTSLNAISKAHRAFARAQVSANLSSALNQGGQLPIILAENGARNVAQALIELRSKDLKSWAAGSDFLTEKKGINYIVTSWKDRAITGAFKPLEIVDGIVSTLAVRSRYLKEVRAGKSAAEAMRLADRFGREVMASRAKGSVPLAFRSKDFLNKMVHMFQLEALNNWEHVIQDLGNRDFREMARAKGKRAAAGSLAAVLVKIILGAFLLNRIDEELYGGTPAPFDVLGLAGNLFAGGLGLTQMDLLRTLVDNVWERLTGERLFDTDPELNEFDAAAGWDDFLWNGLNEIPFASNVAALAGMGDRTLPMPDLSNLADLPGTIAEDGLFSWEVARQLAGLAGDVLPGGRQIEKSIQGGEALLRGGYYRGSGENQRLQFPVEQDFWSIVRGILFGQSALDESRDFYASGQTGLSANQTKAYEQIVDMGADPETVYQAIQGWRAAENDEALNSYGRGVAKRDAITEADLTDEQKLALYRGLSDADSSTPDHFRAMMDTGLSWEEVMEAYDQYQFLNSDEDTPEAERLSASEKATEFASWVERQNYTEDQAETVKEALRYWQMIPAEASEKILLAQEYGVSDSSRKAAAEEIDRLKGDGNSVTQDMAAEALENMPGLDNRERAILWQLQNKSWKWNKNPFDKRVGREVYDRMHEEDEA